MKKIMRKMLKDNDGLSLVEVLVSMALMSLVMSIAVVMMVNGSRFFERQSAQIDLQNESQIVSNYLSECIMEATAFEKITTGPQIAIKLFDEDADASNKRTLVYNVDTKSLYLVNGEVDPSLYETEGYLISKRVSDFTISYSTYVDEADPLVEGDVDETLIRNPLKVYMTYTLYTTIAQRNFEVTANCRNQLLELKDEADIYRATNR